ncbi:MAG: fused MFS/spermidine synthase [Planctomycetes bacterium]|nr:fused MFS/spermidine synthase [Planctomycetota bacterium]
MGPSLGRLSASAGLAGFGCMAGELIAVRLLAPHFGDSAYVWTNVIGIILAALAAGAWLGGRLAARPNAETWPWRLLAAAGAWLAVAPFASTPLGGWLLPSGLPLDAAMPALVRGSFVATLLLFGPAMLLLGAVSPLLITMAVRRAVAVGRAAGTIGAAGTLGSLGGTFAATHWLVPEFGCRIASMVAGALLLAAAACAAPRAGGRWVAGAGVLAVAIGTLLHGGPLRPAPPGMELLAEREGRYQFLQVVRTTAGDGPRRTLLLVNEGLDSFHSIYVEGSALTGGAYYDWHALAPLLAADGARPPELAVLSIGDAAGTLRAVYAGVHPGARVDGVDIDPLGRELGLQFFAPEQAPGRAYTLDGRVFLQQATEQWHVVHVDAYAHQVYVPAHLASREFFAQVRQRLRPGGVCACNVGALRAEDPVLRAIATTMAAEFGHALAFQVPASRNALLVARRGERPRPAALAGFVFGQERLSPPDAEAWRHLVAAAANEAAWVEFAADGRGLVDDRPELDRLLHASYLHQEDPGQPVPCRGDLEPAGAELRAFSLAQARRWTEVLQTVAQSRDATAYLRELAGDARWSLRQLHSAIAEYDAARQLAAGDARVGSRLQDKLEAARSELQPIERADRVAADLGRLQLAGCAVFLAFLLVAAWRTGRPPGHPPTADG